MNHFFGQKGRIVKKNRWVIAVFRCFLRGILKHKSSSQVKLLWSPEPSGRFDQLVKLGIRDFKTKKLLLREAFVENNGFEPMTSTLPV
jgi:hypothetical protein